MSIDLKDLRFDVIEPVCDVLRATDAIGRSFVPSDRDEQIFELRRRCPDIHTSATLVDARALWNAAQVQDVGFQPAALIDRPPYRVGTRTLVDAGRLAYPHDHGVAILTWVVDDAPTMRALVELGVDGIYTRYPDRLAKIVARYEKTRPTS